MSNTIVRPTALGAALAMAALKVDHTTVNPTGKDGVAHDNWVARRVAINMDTTTLGVYREPAFNAHLSFKTAKKLGFTP